jgi:hypothetical protein
VCVIKAVDFEVMIEIFFICTCNIWMTAFHCPYKPHLV